jgi:hypothetical protein
VLKWVIYRAILRRSTFNLEAIQVPKLGHFIKIQSDWYPRVLGKIVAKYLNLYFLVTGAFASDLLYAFIAIFSVRASILRVQHVTEVCANVRVSGCMFLGFIMHRLTVNVTNRCEYIYESGCMFLGFTMHRSTLPLLRKSPRVG